MGVPKFFRYISERYPCLSELVKEHQIPQFDNLYLDMNGIIHNCSHPDDDDPHFRITEEKIIQDIFHYIEVLFRMIKPHKLFFMAIDGVAPRAKMNQQRARRFRSAKDAEKLEDRAKKKGEVLPTEARFDSNCITPGTIFMAKLHEQLKYFVINKISTDKLWTKCKIILSGHETPGEGEHKIMDYIRYMRAQPNYDPNTRHCLYGLDADLIMLGLCTHEPHFSLLREEVKFGRKSTKRKTTPEEITFYLLHLSLMREYLELEFKELELDERMKFRLDIESIIDDWVLMGFLVGNDFIPNLPNLHIANGALPVLYSTYMKVLPTFDGYINEGGTLNLVRFEKFMEALAAIDLDNFQEQYIDIKYFEMKTGRKPNSTQRKSYKLEDWKPDNGELDNVDTEDFIQFEPLEPPRNSEVAALIQATNDELFGNSNENELSDSEDDTGDIEAEFKQHKRDYYTNKLNYECVTPEVLLSQAEGYVRAIQWNLNYYYNGVCSWSWFYSHHYAPYISDIKGFSHLKLEFELGQPFHPYEQLLGVLPALSKTLLPEAFHNLMTDESSLIKSFYPEEFETDLNGKKAEWEAVVLIPFIDEKLLLKAMAECADQLTPEEVRRNQHGPMLIYEHTATVQPSYEAPEYFPTVQPNYAICQELTIEEIRVPQEKLIKGAYPGVKQDIYFPGFPTMKHLKYEHHVEKAHIKVHEYPSRSENMILTIIHDGPPPALDILARELLGRVVYVAWPHLSEALVVAVSSKQFRYNSTGEPGQYNVTEARGHAENNWKEEKNAITSYYHNRFGIRVGETDVLIHVKILIGRKYAFTKQGRVTLEKQWAQIGTAYPYQSIVRDISVHDEHYTTFRDIEDVFPIGSTCFMLGHPYYGCTGEVKDSKETIKNGRIKVGMKCPEEPDFESIRDYAKNIKIKYISAGEAAAKLAISRLLFTKITGSILVSLASKLSSAEDTNKVNVGLNLKFTKKNEEVPGYTKRDGTIWLYSEKVSDLVKEYHEFCPELFDYLNDSKENFCYVDDIFPDSSGKEKIIELSNWIKAQPYYNVDKRPCGTKMLEPEVIRKIQEHIDEYKTKVNKKQDEVTLQVKPHVLYKPDIFIGHIVPDSDSRYQLYDRVVNVRESFTVPLGLKGTVIAIHRSEENQDTGYDVVFDEEFVGGYSMNCSANRGYRLPKSALINISYGKREYERKTGKPGELTNQMRTSMKHNPGTHPQQSAFVPCPPGGNPKLTYHPQNNSYMYQNYNNIYVPPHARGQPPQSRTQLPLSAMVQPRNTVPPFTNNNQRPKNNAGRVNESQYNNTRQITLKERRTDNQPQQQQQQRQQQPPNIDADYLKKVLKITPNKTTKTEETSNENQKQLKVEDLFTHVNSKPLAAIQPKQEAVTSNSVRLLSYYQSNGLGCPHYSYFDLPNKTIQAQLINPLNRQVVCGQPSMNKVEACENVAGEVLKIVENIPRTQPPIPLIPQPPINWRQPQNRTPAKDQGRVKINTPPNLKSNVNLSASASPFIPLQVVRSHINKNSNMNKNDVMKSSSSNTTNNINNLREQNHSSKNMIAPTTEKPLRKRTMRIAANFPTQFEE